MNARAFLSSVAAGAVAVVGLAGCSYEGADSLPLPGTIGGEDTYEVTAFFSDATNLVPKETCRTNDTIIGSVVSVELTDDLQAEVVCAIKDEIELPKNGTASLRETSLLGERFVSFDVPTGVHAATGSLKPGAVVPQTATRVDPNVEMVFGALSQLLNGGSLGSLQTISEELTNALSVTDFGAAAKQIGTLVDNFDDNKDEFVRSLEALDRLAGGIADQRTALQQALDSIPGGLAVLDRQRPKLVATLRHLQKLSRVAVPLIERSKANTVANLRHLNPLLRELGKEGDELALTLERVASFPFPSNTLATVKGDFSGMYAQLVLDIDSLNGVLPQPPGSTAPPRSQTEEPAPLPLLNLPSLPGINLPGLPGLGLLSGSTSDSPLAGLLGGRP